MVNWLKYNCFFLSFICQFYTANLLKAEIVSLGIFAKYLDKLMKKLLYYHRIKYNKWVFNNIIENLFNVLGK